VASRVVHVLGAMLSPEQQRPRGARSAEAYDEFLQGEFAFNSIDDPVKYQEARIHYERALALDPTYAPAMAHLAVIESRATSHSTQKLGPTCAGRSATSGHSVSRRPSGPVAGPLN